jgi:hypothetical protein
VLARAWPELAGGSPPSRATLAAWLARTGGPALRLVAPADAPAGYEAAVAEGAVPTREGSWHDVFNVLAFVAFPRTKLALHGRCLALQRVRAAAGCPAGVRSREQDALALLDECTLVIAGAPEAIAALDAARLAGSLAEVDEVVRAHGLPVHVLGHALLEHLLLDRAPIDAGVVPLPLAEPPTRAAIDRVLAERISAGGFPAPCVRPSVPWPDPTVDAWIGRPRPPPRGAPRTSPRPPPKHPPSGDPAPPSGPIAAHDAAREPRPPRWRQ